MSEQDEIEKQYCDGCDFPGLPLKEYVKSSFNRADITYRFCTVCAQTFIGNSAQYPSQYPREVLRTIGYCTNLILKAIKDAGPSPRE